MKCLFGYNEKTKSYRSDEFIIRTLSDEQLDYLGNLVDDKSEDFNIRHNFNWMTDLGKTFIALSFFLSFLLVFIKIVFEDVTNDLWWFFIVAGILLLVGIVFSIINNLKERKEKNNSDSNDIDVDIDYAIEQSNLQLDVPSTALNIDVIGVEFKDFSDNDEDTNSKNFICITNDEYDVFIEDEKLCFSDCYEVVGIPLSSITEVIEVDEELLLKKWVKKDSYDSYEHSEYNIRKTENGFIISSYLKIIFNINDSDYYFSIPNYDADKFRKLINQYQSNLNLK